MPLRGTDIAMFVERFNEAYKAMYDYLDQSQYATRAGGARSTYLWDDARNFISLNVGEAETNSTVEITQRCQ